MPNYNMENSLSILLTNHCVLFLDLMDYPESDEDGALAKDGAAMLDEDDTEQGEAAALSATGSGVGAPGFLARPNLPTTLQWGRNASARAPAL
jgi:hypothetical protein